MEKKLDIDRLKGTEKKIDLKDLDKPYGQRMREVREEENRANRFIENKAERSERGVKRQKKSLRINLRSGASKKSSYEKYSDVDRDTRTILAYRKK